jgi:sugar lactone lactonase YvrE
MTVKRLVLLLCAFVLLAAVPAVAKSGPDVISLPNGFRPEGISIGNGHTFYVGSIPTGAIYRGDLKSGQGSILVPPAAGRAAIGTEVDDGRIFVAGGPTGKGFVYDAETGALLAEYQLAVDPSTTFVNDLVVTKDGAWFTDSRQPFLYFVPVRNGTLGTQAAVRRLQLTGFPMGEGNNANGIEATPDGKTLIVVNSALRQLFRVDPSTGAAAQIQLTGGDVANGDGLLLHGKTLYVVQNRLNQVAVVKLGNDLATGEILGHITHPALDVPTTLARWGNRLYTVNARFTTPPTPTTAYDVVRLPKTKLK